MVADGIFGKPIYNFLFWANSKQGSIYNRLADISGKSWHDLELGIQGPPRSNMMLYSHIIKTLTLAFKVTIGQI